MSTDKNQAPRGIAPALTLMVLAPLVAEVLSGATRLSYIFVLLPEILVWGGGALLIRETVRRWGGGWPSMLSLGLCLSIAEEFLIQQTSLAPLPWLGNIPSYGRVWGINWPYFLFMLGYESVLVVMVPVQLTELLFPHRRNVPWLRRRGLIIVSALFLFGSRIAWYAWTQRARPMIFHVPKYTPPTITLALGALAIALLTTLAYALRNSTPPATNTGKSPTWLVALGTLFFGFPWYILMTLVFAPRSVSLWIPMLGGAIWPILALLVVRRWTSSSNWAGLQRWALVSSATLVCMVAGFSGSSTWLRIDLIGKIAMNVIAAALLLKLGTSIAKRTTL